MGLRHYHPQAKQESLKIVSPLRSHSFTRRAPRAPLALPGLPPSATGSSSALPLACQAFLLLVTPSNSHWPRWGTCKTEKPPQMQKKQVAGDLSPSLSMVRRATKGIGGHAQRWQSPPASSQPSISATTSSSAEGQLMNLAEHGLSGLIFNRFGSVVQLTTWLDKHCLLGGRWGQKQTLHFSQVEAILDPTLCLQSERSQAHRILTSLSEPRPCPALTC